MTDLVQLDTAAPSTLRPRAQLLATQIDHVDMYALSRTRLEVYAGLLVPTGRVLVFCGQLFRDWLPGASTFVPATIRSVRDYGVEKVENHPIFDGVNEADLTYRRGVAGFFARGHHAPPPGAEVVLRLAGGQPIVYIDRVSTDGTILVHSGNDLLGYVDDSTTAGRIVPQLLGWMREEARTRTRVRLEV